MTMLQLVRLHGDKEGLLKVLGSNNTIFEKSDCYV